MSEAFNNGMNERGFTVQDYKDSISAEDSNDMFTLAYQWQDKKHRHVWDLCNWIEQLQAQLSKAKPVLDAARKIELATDGMTVIGNRGSHSVLPLYELCEAVRAMEE